MNKLAKILLLAENFYTKAMFALGAEPYTHYMPDDPEGDDEEGEEGDEPGGDLLEQIDEIRKQIVNPDLRKQLSMFISSYISYSDALNDPSSIPEDETFEDISNTLQTRWERLLSNDYLNLDDNDPRYKEKLTPYEIVGAIQKIIDDVNAQKENKAQSLGVTKEDLDEAARVVQQQMFQSQVTKDVIDKLDDNQKQQYANKVKKQLEYQKKHRENLKNIRKIGPDNLKRIREKLEQQIASTTDAIARKELENRLKHTPDPRQLEVAQEGRKRRHENMLKDPKRKANHEEGLRKRQALYRGYVSKRNELMDLYQKATSPSEKLRYRNEMVKLESIILERSHLDLDDDFVRHDPNIAKLLNPEEIVKRNIERAAKHEMWDKKEVETRRSNKAAGNLVGLTTTYQQQLSTLVNDVKKKVQKKLDKEGLVDPFFNQYTSALAAAVEANSKAPSPANQAKVHEAEKAIVAATKQYKENNPLVTSINQKLEHMVILKDELKALVGNAQRTSKPRNPWIYEDKVPAQHRAIVQDIITRAESCYTTLSSFTPGTAQVLRQIIEQLKGKL